MATKKPATFSGNPLPHNDVQPIIHDDHGRPLRIVVVEAGWVFQGYYEREFPDQHGNKVSGTGAVLLHDSSCIRTWGTEHGLGQIALTGPTKETIYDANGVMRIEHHAVLFSIDCVAKAQT